MATTQPFSLNVDGHAVNGIVHPPANSGRRPTVVLCHGFKGFMEWGFFPHLAELLAARGFCTLRINFSGSGMQPGDELVSDTEAFKTATFSKDLRELNAVIDAVGRIAPGSADPGWIGLVGHSRGGGTALLASALHDSVRALVTWSAVGTFHRLPAQVVEQWRRCGEVPIVNGRTGQELAIGLEVLEDLEARADELDLEAAAARRSAPWLLIHGTEDETVPFPEAQRLLSVAADPSELLAVHLADHTFGAKHPLVSPTPQLIEAMNATQSWLRRHLTGPS
jgi:pimeloyl-ACP methyl ester carboxylesterase